MPVDIRVLLDRIRPHVFLAGSWRSQQAVRVRTLPELGMWTACWRTCGHPWRKTFVRGEEVPYHRLGDDRQMRT